MHSHDGHKTALVTGFTGKIGYAIAAGLVSAGYSVVGVGRDAARVDQAARQLGHGARGETCDLSYHAEIRALAARVSGPLDVLVNNAAQCPRRRSETTEGIELQWATNVLAYVWMIDAFGDHLRRAAPARVVNVASYWAGGLDLGDLQFRRRAYDNDDAYRQSKQANRMLTAAIASRLDGDGITVNCCHPGDVRSKLSTDLGFGGHESPEQGARTPVYLATSAEISGVTGRYFASGRPERCQFAEDRSALEALYQACRAYA
jgi:retinol dehydrogenase-13